MSIKPQVESIKTALNDATEGFILIPQPNNDKSSVACYIRKAHGLVIEAKHALNQALKTLK